MKKFTNAACILFVCIIFCSNCMQFRWSDSKAVRVFGSRNVPLNISDTLLGGCTIHYARCGEDSLPTLVFIHGSPGSWSYFRKYMWDDSLKKKFRFISFDRPGFGYSNFGEPMHLREQSELLLRVIEAHKNGKPIYLAGHSIGGPVAAQLAAMSPGTFEKVVIISGSISPYQEKKESWRHLMNNGVLDEFLPGAFAPSNTEILWFKNDLFQLEKELGTVDTHVIFVHGDKDTWVPIENVAYGKRMMVHAKSITVDTLTGADHHVPRKRMDELKKILGRLY